MMSSSAGQLPASKLGCEGSAPSAAVRTSCEFANRPDSAAGSSSSLSPLHSSARSGCTHRLQTNGHRCYCSMIRLLPANSIQA